MSLLRYNIKTAPTFSPVLLTNLKSSLHIEHTDLDDLLQICLNVAAEDAETMTGRQIARATLTGYLDDYPDNDELEIDKGPVDSILSIKYYAQDSPVLTTVSASDYQLDNIDLTARLRFSKSFTPDRSRMNSVEIEFLAGWASVDAIPETIKDAIVLLASERYLNPDNKMQGNGVRVSAAERLLRKYKIQRY